MNIPEELLKMSQKELNRALVDNVFRTKYFYNNDYKKIYKLEGKIKGDFFLERWGQINHRQLRDRNYIIPLSIEQLNILKIERLKANFKENGGYIKWAIKKFNEAFGEEYVDAFEKSRDYARIIVHFPEITIKNSAEQEHLMRDVYLLFYVNPDSIELRGLKRGTMTEDEYWTGYTFSHIDGKICTIPTWESRFCYGESNTPMSKITKEMNRRGFLSIMKNLPFYLEMIKEYLSWESLEGVPWRRIDSVINNISGWREINSEDGEEYQNLLSYNLSEIYEQVMDKISSFTYEYYLSTGDEWRTKLSSKSVEEIRGVLKEIVPEQVIPVYNNMAMIRMDESDRDEVYSSEEHIKFKGEYRPFSLIPSPVKEISSDINPLILTDVKERIESRFNEFLIKKKINETV